VAPELRGSRAAAPNLRRPVCGREALTPVKAAPAASAPSAPPAAPPAPPAPNPKRRPPGDPGPTQVPSSPEGAKGPQLAASAVGPNPWAEFWTDKRSALVLSSVRADLANWTGDPSLKPNAVTVNFWGPALGRILRSADLGDGAGGVVGAVAARWVMIGLGLVVVFVIALPLALSLSRRRQAQRQGAEEQAAPASNGLRMVGDGQL